MIFQLPDLNVQLILNVQTTLHAYKKNVKTLVTLILVAEMPNVRLKTTEQFVYVFMDTLETLTLCVKNVRLYIILFVLNIFPAKAMFIVGLMNYSIPRIT